MLSLSIAVDSVYYGRLVLTPLTFLNRNVLQSVSLFYGSNPWHWYLSQGLPVLCLTSLPFVVQGWFAIDRRLSYARALLRYPEKVGLKLLAETTFFSIVAFSLLGHKEFRFLQPVLPLLHLLAAYSLTRSRFIFPAAEARRRMAQARPWRNVVSPSAQGDLMLPSEQPARLTRAAAHLERHIAGFREAWSQLDSSRWPAKTMLLAQVPLALYALLFHCVGQEHIMRDLRWIHQRHATGRNVVRSGRASATGPLHSVAFLMPCHSTPWQSHLHLEALEDAGDGGLANNSGDRGKLWFITCEPPGPSQDMQSYQDVSDVFYADPVSFLADRFQSKVDASFPALQDTLSISSRGIPWPSHLVTFEALHQVRGKGAAKKVTVESLLRKKGYQIVLKRWNSLKHEDPRRDGRIVVWQWIG